MTYLQFLALFLAPPIMALAWSLRHQYDRRFWLALAVLMLMALVYTGPWDDHLIAVSVWRYTRAQVLGLRLGRVPLEEYVFYLLQVMLTGLFTLFLLRRGGARAGRQ
ncbi:MAG: lycopene cyclase domain-containing protein [Dehalococcoidia bacterium]